MRKRIVCALLCVLALLSLICPAFAAGNTSEVQTAADFLREQGIMVGDQNGELHLNNALNRAEMATIFVRLKGGANEVAQNQQYYTSMCSFVDVPKWAMPYVGYCTVNRLVYGYGNNKYGAGDPVTPAAACTVVLRACGYAEQEGKAWSYDTACAYATSLGLLDKSVVQASAITRGKMAVLVYRALNQSERGTGTDPTDVVVIPQSDKKMNLMEGDKVLCDDGSVYEITDMSLYDNSLFSKGSLPSLPSPTCDWSQFPELELPQVAVRRTQAKNGDSLYILNLYETRRMQYTLYHAVSNCKELWENGTLKLSSKGNPILRLQLGITEEGGIQPFWPWRDEQLTQVFYSAPMARFAVEAWDVYKDGKFLYTKYNVQVR